MSCITEYNHHRKVVSLTFSCKQRLHSGHSNSCGRSLRESPKPDAEVAQGVERDLVGLQKAQKPPHGLL